METGFFRGAGSGIFELPLPLAENYAYQAERGQLVRVNADGSPHEAAETVEDTGPQKPGKNASKNEWVGYAVSQGMSVDDADAMTRNDLAEKLA